MKRAVVVAFGAVVLASIPAVADAHGGGPESVVSFGAVVNSLHFVATAFWLGGIACWRVVVAPSLQGLREGSGRSCALSPSGLLIWFGGASRFSA